jgi:hypothetical protein
VDESWKVVAKTAYVATAMVSASLAFNVGAAGRVGLGIGLGAGLFAAGYTICVSWLRGYARGQKSAIKELATDLAAQMRKSHS